MVKIYCVYLSLFAILKFTSAYENDKQIYTVGAIFDETDNDLSKAFRIAVKIYNRHQNSHRFKANIKTVAQNDILKVKDTVCKMVEEKDGVVGIFGPLSLNGQSITQSICSTLNIPHIQINWKPTRGSSLSTSLNFYPDTDKLAKGFATIVKHLQWKNYVILYEKEIALIRLQEILKIPNVEDNPVVIKKLSPDGDQRTLLKELGDSKIHQIILDCEPQNIIKILKQAKEVHLLDFFHSYFLTSLDAHLTDFSVLDSRSNITYVRIFNSNNTMLMHAVREWGSYEHFMNEPEDLTTVDIVRTEAVLLHDAVNTFLHTISQQRNHINVDPTPLQCNGDGTYEAGHHLVSFMRKQSFEHTITGPISFGPNGTRTDFNLLLIEAETSYPDVATWSPENPDELQFQRSSSEQQQRILENLQKDTVIVSSRIGRPYLMRRTPSSPDEVLEGNDRYEGYSMDLIQAIAEELNFTFKFVLTEGNYYGNYVPEKKTWNGLIGDLLNKKAHLAICDLTITHQRRQVVDFTLPFMTLGIGILYKKTEEGDRNIFAFMDPFSIEVWIYTSTMYLIISILLFFISRIAPGDWEKPHPCDENPDEKENIWNLKNCFWLTLGSIMTQGCDILPKGISSRMATSMWWFFSLLMTSSYTANLAAFLTMEKMGPTIDSAEALAKSNIKYGVVAGGSTQAFFRESNYSLYQRMWTQMQQFKPSTFEKSNDDGVKRVLNTKNSMYAFFMESVSIEYEVERHCELKQVGDVLDDKGYGIAMPVNAPYRSAINKAILKLQEDGTLSDLKTKWWKEMYGGGACDEEDSGLSSIDQQKLGLSNVGGVFLVLGIGVAIALVIAMGEFLWNVKCLCVEEHITYWEALIIELKFLVNIRVTKKATKIPTPSTSESSDSNQSTRPQSLVEGVLHGARSLLNLDILEKYNPSGKKD
ncbi:glutamate receptor ionotropic, kainate 2-like [Agrilus planipennis]|uniref:Glutamate receptor ionotropic, kainate 2-like n=1 Tax=Agrilus planipennis TaxID=224129 RepID=A0A7F5R828_AGRPL|nr:glutamate receptor ionotropic, kainate 2-like [Agrilus planipennis]